MSEEEQPALPSLDLLQHAQHTISASASALVSAARSVILPDRVRTYTPARVRPITSEVGGQGRGQWRWQGGRQRGGRGKGRDGAGGRGRGHGGWRGSSKPLCTQSGPTARPPRTRQTAPCAPRVCSQEVVYVPFRVLKELFGGSHRHFPSSGAPLPLRVKFSGGWGKKL